jgi:hypothetical protein|tara:strand:+ start:230 stop:406 length:177 start_codon:yes stop_codon:yes gene_type:complete
LGGSNSQALDCGIKIYSKMLVIWHDACDIFILDGIAKNSGINNVVGEKLCQIYLMMIR